MYFAILEPSNPTNCLKSDTRKLYYEKSFHDYILNLHPDRTFHGQEQVKKNWSSNFDEMPDFSVRVLRHFISNNAFWAEWEWQGTRQDKSKLIMRGVTIMGVEDGKIKWGRLYMEPVEVNGKGIDATVKEVMQGKK